VLRGLVSYESIAIGGSCETKSASVGVGNHERGLKHSEPRNVTHRSPAGRFSAGSAIGSRQVSIVNHWLGTEPNGGLFVGELESRSEFR